MSSPWQPFPGPAPIDPPPADGGVPATGGYPEAARMPNADAAPNTGPVGPGDGIAYYPYSSAYPGPGVSGAPRHAAPYGPGGGSPGTAPDAVPAGWSAGATTPPGSAPTAPHAPAPRNRRRVWLALISAVAAVAAAAVIGVVAGYRTAAGEADANYGPRLAAAQSSVASFQDAAAKASEQAEDVPDLLEVASRYFDPAADVSGNADALEITITSSRLVTDVPALSAFLSALGFSDAVIDRMEHTRAMDGTQSAQGHHCNVTWTYHPDHGLQLVFEASPGR